MKLVSLLAVGLVHQVASEEINKPAEALTEVDKPTEAPTEINQPEEVQEESNEPEEGSKKTKKPKKEGTRGYFEIKPDGTKGKWHPPTGDYALAANLRANLRAGNVLGGPGLYNGTRTAKAMKNLVKTSVVGPSKRQMLDYLSYQAQQQTGDGGTEYVIEKHYSKYGLTCGVTGEKADNLESILYNKAREDREQTNRSRREADENDADDGPKGERIFGGSKSDISKQPWQAYFHISNKLTDPLEIEQWEEDNAIDPEWEDDMNEIKAMIDEGADDPILTEMLQNFEEVLYSERIPRASFLCGAVIIAPAFLLSAAHCTIRATDQANSAIIAGLTELDMGSAIPPENWFPILEITTHEGWDEKSLVHDIGLIKTTRNMHFSQKLAPVCLPTKNFCLKAGHKLKVSGWGATEDFGDQWEKYNDFTVDADGYTIEKEHLRSVVVPIMNHRDCIAKYSDAFWDTEEGRLKRETFINHKHICAGGEYNKDACNGDSGGPLTYMDRFGVQTLVGLVSWGDYCGEMGYPTVYTRVSAYTDWIAEKAQTFVMTRDVTGKQEDGQYHWKRDPFKFGKCYDNDYTGDAEFQLGLKSEEKRKYAPYYVHPTLPGPNDVQNDNEHITPDFFDMEIPTDPNDPYVNADGEKVGSRGAVYGLKKYFCVTRGNIHIGPLSPKQGLKVSDCRMATSLDSKFVMNNREKQIEAAGLGSSGTKYCLVAVDPTFRANQGNKHAANFFVQLETCDTKKQAKNDEERKDEELIHGVRYREFKYDRKTCQVWVNSRGKEFDGYRLTIGYNMWRQDKLVLRYPMYYQWGVTHYPDANGDPVPAQLIDPDTGKLHLLPQSTFHLGRSRNQYVNADKNTAVDAWYPFRFCMNIINKKMLQGPEPAEGKPDTRRVVYRKATVMIKCEDWDAQSDRNRTTWSMTKFGQLKGTFYDEFKPKPTPPKPKKRDGECQPDLDKLNKMLKGKKKKQKKKLLAKVKEQVKACNAQKKKEIQEWEAKYGTIEYEPGKMRSYCLAIKFNPVTFKNIAGSTVKVAECLGEKASELNGKLDKAFWKSQQLKFDKKRNLIRANANKKDEFDEANRWCIHPKLKYDECGNNKFPLYEWTEVVASECVYSFSWNCNDPHHRHEGREADFREFGNNYLQGYDERVKNKRHKEIDDACYRKNGIDPNP